MIFALSKKVRRQQYRDPQMRHKNCHTNISAKKSDDMATTLTCTFLGQNRQKKLIELWVELIQIAHHLSLSYKDFTVYLEMRVFALKSWLAWVHSPHWRLPRPRSWMASHFPAWLQRRSFLPMPYKNCLPWLHSHRKKSRVLSKSHREQHGKPKKSQKDYLITRISISNLDSLSLIVRKIDF